MNNIGEKFLPIGTVVMLKGGSKRVMITGFCSISSEDQNTMFDYSGCMYPEGFLSSDQTALFNHDQIETIYYKGLVDEEEQKFKTTLNALVAQMQSKANQTAPVSSVQPSEESVPPIGPGLPGYVAPQPVAPVQPVEEPVPPMGPGLPGYVAPQPVASQPVQPVQPVIPQQPVMQQQPVVNPGTLPNIQFDQM